MDKVIVYRPWNKDLEGLKIYSIGNEAEERHVLISILKAHMESDWDDPEDSPLVDEPSRLVEPLIRLHASEDEIASAQARWEELQAAHAEEVIRHGEGLAWYAGKADAIRTSTLWAWVNLDAFVGEGNVAAVKLKVEAPPAM